MNYDRKETTFQCLIWKAVSLLFIVYKCCSMSIKVKKYVYNPKNCALFIDLKWVYNLSAKETELRFSFKVIIVPDERFEPK